MQRFDRITWNPKQMNGQPCIREMRLTVRRVVEAVALYPDRADLFRNYPELEGRGSPSGISIRRRKSQRQARLTDWENRVTDRMRSMAMRQIQLIPEAEPILDSVAASFGGDAGRALSELLIAHEAIETFLDDLEASNAAELRRQRDRSMADFNAGHTASWEQVKLENDL